MSDDPLGPNDDPQSDRPAVLADNGAQDPADPSPLVAALLRERAGYVNRGLDQRLAAVDAELDRLGASAERATTAKPKTSRATSKG